MTDEKPSRNEDDYFKKLDQELLKAQRAQQEREAAENSRASFFMRCPKDGSELTERDMNGVKVDVCTGCSGIWLDAGELDALRGGGQSGMSQFFSNLFSR